MDVGYTLPILLLLIGAASLMPPQLPSPISKSGQPVIRPGRSSSHLLHRSNRRITLNEYLIPPPPPLSSPSSYRGRSPRLTNVGSRDNQGQFSRFMNWFNPFPNGPGPNQSPSPSVYQPEGAASSRHSKYIDLHPPHQSYNGPPPLPATPFNGPNLVNEASYPPRIETNNCNPCDSVPWIPMQPNNDLYHQSSQTSYSETNFQIPSIGSLPLSDHNVPEISNLHSEPNPPIFKAIPFDGVPKSDTIPQENIKYLSVTSSTLRPQLWIETSDSNVRNDQIVGEDQHRQTNISLLEESIPGHYEDLLNSRIEESDFPTSTTRVEVNYDTQDYIDIPEESHEFSNPIPFENRENAFQRNHYDTTSPKTIIHFVESPLLDLTKNDNDGEEETKISTSTISNFHQSNLEKTNSVVENSEALFGTTLFDFSTESSKEKINQPNGNRANLNRIGQKNSLSNIVKNGYPRQLLSSTSTTTTTTIKPNKPIPFIEALMKSYENFRNQGLHNYFNEDNDESPTNIGQITTVNLNGNKRNKQVQVIIPYTSQHTPIPFHPTSNDWSMKDVLDFHDLKKLVKTKDESLTNRDNYFNKETKSKIIPGSSGKLAISLDDIEAIATITTERGSVASTRVNNSIDVHRLQKNIDNWTIQEYSIGTTLSTVSPSSSKPHLLRSKQIPDEYLVTTESVNNLINSIDENRSDDGEVNVRSYGVRGFNFNDLEHEESSNVRIETSKIFHVDPHSANNETRSKTGKSKEESAMEQIHVVTPQSIDASISNSYHSDDVKKKTKNNQKGNQYELIERVYQMLPQAVNNLAVVSTGPENVPLWGIMEHEEYASHGSDNTDDDENREEENQPPLEAPVLYVGHSKVSHSRR